MIHNDTGGFSGASGKIAAKMNKIELSPEQEKQIHGYLAGGDDPENEGIMGYLKKMDIMPANINLKDENMGEALRMMMRVLLKMLGPLGDSLLTLFDEDKSAMNNLAALNGITDKAARKHGASENLGQQVVDAIREKVGTGELKFRSDGDKEIFLNKLDGLAGGFDYNHLGRFNREVNKILGESGKFIEFSDYIPANENISYGQPIPIDAKTSAYFDGTIPIMDMKGNGSLTFKNQNLTLQDIPTGSTFQFVKDKDGSVTNGLIKTPEGGAYYVGVEPEQEEGTQQKEIDGFNIGAVNDEKIIKTLLSPETDMGMGSGPGMNPAPNMGKNPGMSIR